MSDLSSPSPSSSSSTPTPPHEIKGIVLDENGKPCKVCTGWQAWAKNAKSSSSKPGESSKSSVAKGLGGMAGFGAMASGSSSSSSSGSNSKSTAVEEELEPTRPSDCPPDVEILGRSTWTFLHTTAAYYPIQASPAQQTQMKSLLTALGSFYPCKPCANDFKEDMAANEPDVSGREGLSRWLCERHNEVNVKLGKENFDCGKTDERWKDGWKDGSCD